MIEIIELNYVSCKMNVFIFSVSVYILKFLIKKVGKMAIKQCHNPLLGHEPPFEQRQTVSWWQASAKPSQREMKLQCGCQ